MFFSKTIVNPFRNNNSPETIKRNMKQTHLLSSLSPTPPLMRGGTGGGGKGVQKNFSNKTLWWGFLDPLS